MFCKPSKKTLCLLILTILCMGSVSITGAAGADESIFVITGNIEKIETRVITLKGGMKLEPFQEIVLPEWVVVGAPATLSYVVRPRGNCYLEIVKPGEELKVKEKLELYQRRKY